MQMSTENWTTLKTFIQKSYKNDTNALVGSIIKSAIVGSIGYIWFLDKDFCINELDCLFSNVVDNKNLSFIAFNFSMFYNPVFVTSLFEKGILIKLLNSKEYHQSWNYVYLIISLFVSGQIESKIVENVLSTKEANQGFSYFISNESDRKFNKNERKRINGLFKLVGDSGLSDPDHCAELLIQNNEAFYDYSNYFSCVKKLLISQNSSTFADDYTKIFKLSRFNEVEIEELVFIYLSNLDSYTLFFDEICELVKSVEWGSKYSRDEVIIMLGKKNPKFYKIENDIKK